MSKDWTPVTLDTAEGDTEMAMAEVADCVSRSTGQKIQWRKKECSWFKGLMTYEPYEPEFTGELTYPDEKEE